MYLRQESNTAFFLVVSFNIFLFFFEDFALGTLEEDEKGGIVSVYPQYISFPIFG